MRASAKGLPASAGPFCNAPFVKLTKNHRLSLIDMIDADLRGFVGPLYLAKVASLGDLRCASRCGFG
jgi:hypothetical protein